MSGRTYRDRVTVGTRSIYPVAGDPDGSITGDAGDIGIDPAGATYECLGGTVWAIQQPVKICADAAGAQAYVGGVEGQMAYITNLLTYYIWRANPGNAADGVHVTTTGDGGTTRWTGISGLYIGQPVNSFSTNAVIQGVRYQAGAGDPNGAVASVIGSRYVDNTTGLEWRNQDGNQSWALVVGIKQFPDVATAEAYTDAVDGDECYVVTTNTTYRYLTLGAAFTDDNTFVLSTGNGGNTRWVGTRGQYVAEITRFGRGIAGQTILSTATLAASGPVNHGVGLYVLNGAGALVDAQLPTAASVPGEIFTFITTSITNAVRVLPQGGDTIADLTSYTPRIVPSVFSLQSDGANNWDIVFRGTDPARERQRDVREVAVSGANTVEAQGVLELNYAVVGLYVKSVVVATVGVYTLAGERLSDSQNILNAATFDLTGLVADTWTAVPLHATVANRTMVGLDSFKLSFVSDNAGLDAQGVMWMAVLELVN